MASEYELMIKLSIGKREAGGICGGRVLTLAGLEGVGGHGIGEYGLGMRMPNWVRLVMVVLRVGLGEGFVEEDGGCWGKELALFGNGHSRDWIRLVIQRG